MHRTLAPGHRFVALCALLWLAACSTPAPDSTGVGSTRQAIGNQSCPACSWGPHYTAPGFAPTARGNQTAVWTGSKMLVWGGLDNSGTVGTGSAYEAATSTWTAISNVGAPEARGYHTAIWTGSRMIVWGGFGNNGSLSSGAAYDPANDSWTPLSNTGAPSSRYFHSAVWTGSRMIVFGGFGDVDLLADGAAYDPAQDTWTPIANAASTRGFHSAVWTGSRMIVWGGVGAFGNGGPLGDGEAYDPARDAWTTLSSVNAPDAREGHTAVWTGSRMLVFGGLGNAGYLGDGSAYDPATDSWTPLSANNAPSSRYYQTALWTGSRMLVFGGFGDNGPIADGSSYDPAQDAWAPLSFVTIPSARYTHSAVWTGSTMIVFGGSSDSGYQGDGGIYDPAQDSWIRLPLVNGPVPRSRQGAVWTGSRLLVFGGFNSPDAIGDGWSYDPQGPQAQQWTPMSSTNAPSPRYLESAVWTGSKMIVFGGGSITGLKGDGGVYDPENDTWTPVSLVGAPSARYQHSAIWTGSRMIVFGGTDFTGNFSGDGAAYDPANDRWTPLSALDAPPARNNHTAVWTGSRMIVFAGSGNTGLLNDAWSYDPAEDVWTRLSNPPSVPARAFHKAVWTGSHMLVVGGVGTNQAAYLAQSYDPATDTWSPLSATNLPSPRTDHSAIWTGSRMVVFGGESNLTLLGDGAAYDPVADTWTPLSNIAPPSPRYAHSAVWTGNQMLIYGGAGPAALGDVIPYSCPAASCDDGSACTRTDTCQFGTCAGSNPISCAALDECHVAGACNPGTGACSNPSSPDGTACTDDGNPCSRDACQAGACSHPAGNAGVVCRVSAGFCDVAEVCDGNSAACPANAFQVAGIQCGAASCDPLGNSATAGAMCDGAGSCAPGPRVTCGGYTCDANLISCRVACTGDGDCSAGNYCDGNGACVAKKVAGAACTSASQCGSGFCTDGVCCNSACGDGATDDCQACSVAAGGSVDGTCTPFAAGTQCRASTGSCDVAEVCDGAGTACPADTFKPAGTVCRASAGACDIAETCTGVGATCPADAFQPPTYVCASASCANGSQSPAVLCSGQSAACAPATPSVCAPYVCGADACLNSCAGDGDCVAGRVCRSGACVFLPIAKAGSDHTVSENTVVTLDGSGSASVPPGTPLGYLWSQIAGPAVALNNPAIVNPTFTAPSVAVAGAILTFQLVVSDGQQQSLPAYINITVKNVNNPPVADAGPDQTVPSAALVTLDGTHSTDLDADPLTYTWVQIDNGAPTVTLLGAASPTPTFTAPVNGNAQPIQLRFQLTVSDGIDSTSDQVDVFVQQQNRAPIADAGPDQTRPAGSVVVLNAVGSSDPDQDPLTYAWSQTSGPAVTLSDAHSATPAFTAPQGNATLKFNLVVTDNHGASSAPDSVTITIQAGAADLCSTNFVGLPNQTCTTTTTVRSLAELQAWVSGPRTTNLLAVARNGGSGYDFGGSDLTIQTNCDVTFNAAADFSNLGNVLITASHLLVRNDLVPVVGPIRTFHLRAGGQVEVKPASTAKNASVIVESPAILYRGDVGAQAATVAMCGGTVETGAASEMHAAEVFVNATSDLLLRGDILGAACVTLAGSTVTLKPANQIGSVSAPAGRVRITTPGRFDDQGDIHATGTVTLQTGTYRLYPSYSFQAGSCTISGSVAAQSKPLSGCTQQ